MLKTVKAEPSLGKFRLLISYTDYQITVKEFKLPSTQMGFYPLSDTYLENLKKDFLDLNFIYCKQLIPFSLSNLVRVRK